MSGKLSEKELLSEVKRLKKELGHTPKSSDMDEYGNYSKTTYYNKFDSWYKALEEAGIEPNTGREFTEEELIDELQNLGERLNRTPRMDDMNKMGEYSGSTYQRYFDSWNNAVEKAGFKPR